MTVVTPSLNQGRFIEDCLRSVLAQDYRPIEHLVVDGASTDGTPDILARHSHVVWTSRPDHGHADAVNQGFGRARGDILGWLCADDAYAPGAVRAAVDHFTRHPEIDLVYGDLFEVDAQGEVWAFRRPGPFDLGRLLTRELRLPQPTVFLRRRVAQTLGPLEPGMPLAFVLEYWIRAARRFRVAYVPAIRGYLRAHPSAKSHAEAHRFLAEILTVLERAFDDPTLPAEVRPLRARAFACAQLEDGIRAYNARAWRHARGQLAAVALRTPAAGLRARLVAALLALDATTRLRLIGRVRARQARRAAQRLGLPRLARPGGGPGP